MITKFKIFENTETKYINVAIDASASCLSLLRNIMDMIDLGDYDKINLITFNEPPKKYTVVDKIDIQKIYFQYMGDGRITPVINFIIENDLNNYKTFIISDFMENEKPDYDKLNNYELVNVVDLYNKIDKYNL